MFPFAAGCWRDVCNGCWRDVCNGCWREFCNGVCFVDIPGAVSDEVCFDEESTVVIVLMLGASLCAVV